VGASKKAAWAKEHELTLELSRRLAVSDRQLRIYRSREQDLAERYQSAPDADGIGGRSSVTVLRDKNVPYVVSIVNAAPTYAKKYGFRLGMQFLREHLIVAINALWVAPTDNPFKVQLKHRLLQWVADDGMLGLMMRRDLQGGAERSRLIQAIGSFAAGFSFPYAFRTSQETFVEPVEAERRPQPA
jgi:hypothetical protein